MDKDKVFAQAMSALSREKWRQALNEIPFRYLFLKMIIVLGIILIGSALSICFMPIEWLNSPWKLIGAIVIYGIIVGIPGVLLLNKIDEKAMAWAKYRYKELLNELY